MAKKKGNAPNEGHVSGQSNRVLSTSAHALTWQQLEQELGSNSLNGISPEEAKSRYDEFGANELGEGEGIQPLRIVIAQIANAMTMVRFHASPISGPQGPGPMAQCRFRAQGLGSRVRVRVQVQGPGSSPDLHVHLTD